MHIKEYLKRFAQLERCHFFPTRHCTFILIFLPCRFKNWNRTEHRCRTGAIFTAHTVFSTVRPSVYTCVKTGTARLIEVPRPTYLVVLDTDKNRTVYTVRICRAVPKNSGTRTKILAVPCPKRYSVNGVYGPSLHSGNVSIVNLKDILNIYKICGVFFSIKIG